MIEVDWVEVPTGRLVRGTPFEEIEALARLHELPRHYFAKEAPRSELEVQAFAISLTPVTQGQWRVFCDVVGWAPPVGSDLLPVEVTDWAAAKAFCQWVSEELGFAVRLPTETQWERAARGGDDREYPWGDEYDVTRANLAELGVGQTIPVGSLPAGASPFGVLDMAGNVDEWTETTYAPYPGASSDVPVVEPQAYDVHVTRGGSYRHGGDLARCARRHGIYLPGDPAGIRLVTS